MVGEEGEAVFRVVVEFTVKALSLGLASTLTLITSMSAFGGPDWDGIEKGRAAKRAEAVQQAESGKEKKILVPLDHGPRADTTPWLNRKGLERFQREMAEKESKQPQSSAK